jgi:hypothetical protein
MSGRPLMRDRTFYFRRAVVAWLRKVETEWPRLSVESNRKGVSETRFGPFLAVLIEWVQALSPVAKFQPSSFQRPPGQVGSSMSKRLITV